MTSILFYVLIIIAVSAAISLNSYRNKMKFIKRHIIDLWGKEVPGKLTDEDMSNISSYFNNKKSENSSIIDDITWNDLDMNGLYKRMNNTQSTAGEEVLLNILRTPLYDEDALKKRDRIIAYFQNSEHDKERIGMQYALAKFGKSRELCVTNFFFNEETASSSKLILYRILSVIPLVSLALIFIAGKPFISLLILSVAFNMYTHYKLQQINGAKFHGFSYITSMVQCAFKLSKYDINELRDYSHEVQPSLNKVKSIKNKVFNLSSSAAVNDALILTEYIGILFLTEVINFEKMKYMLVKNREDFRKVYEYVGSIDALISLASYRKSLQYYSNPVLTNSVKHLSVKDMYHPLIKNPVVNSCSLNKSMLITGSNASGKSTFLKTLAINVLMAQTIYTCTAMEYDSSFFMLYSSMALRDNIFNSESYYIVEIKSLKRIIDSLNDEVPCLCFVDEILRGTNTVERISSSSEVLNYFGNSNCICVAATHDIELTHILESVFDNYHFQEEIVDNQIKFDYKLYSGRAETRNAIKLLGFLGYKESIVKRAEERAEDFLKTGIWKNV